MPSPSSLLKVSNSLNRLGICYLLRIVWRVNEIQLLLNPRLLPLHDSQQILGIRLNAWQRKISYVREWYQKEHKNWVWVDGQRSKWWVWNQALDEARKSVRQIRTDLQRLSEGISNHPNTFYRQTQKTEDTWKFSGMLIVYWPITIKFRIGKQTSKPQTNYRCCLRFSYLVPYWLISRNTITFHKYFWCSRFCEFHSDIRSYNS